MIPTLQREIGNVSKVEKQPTFGKELSPSPMKKRVKKEPMQNPFLFEYKMESPPKSSSRPKSKGLMEQVEQKNKRIGKGSFGCVFEPPYPCLNSTFDCTNCVGKTFKYEEFFAKELNNAKIVKSMDREGKYHFPYLSTCYVDTKLVFPGCETYIPSTTQKIPQKKSPMIIYEKGGESLYSNIRAIRDKNDVIQILKNIQNLVEGLKLFHRYGYYHLDIKNDNVLLSDRGFKFIDFGLGVYLPKFKRDNYYFGVYFWPIYTVLLSEIVEENPEQTIRDFVKMYYKEVYAKQSKKFRLLQGDAEEKDMIEYLLEAYQTIKPHVILERIDLFELGKMVYDVLESTSKLYPEGMKDFDNYLKLSLNINLFDPVTTDEVYKAYTEALQKL